MIDNQRVVAYNYEAGKGVFTEVGKMLTPLEKKILMPDRVFRGFIMVELEKLVILVFLEQR